MDSTAPEQRRMLVRPETAKPTYTTRWMLQSSRHNYNQASGTRLVRTVPPCVAAGNAFVYRSATKRVCLSDGLLNTEPVLLCNTVGTLVFLLVIRWTMGQARMSISR